MNAPLAAQARDGGGERRVRSDGVVLREGERVGPEGLEPSTRGLKVRCSAN